jgi:hypothetical protein
MLSSVEACAFHEAGHYTVAREMGFDPVSCRADGLGSGRTRYTCPEHDRHTYDGRRKLLSVIFAGLLAEHMQFGMWPNEHAGDHRAATEVALTIPKEIRARVEREQMHEAARILRSRWGLVEAVAERLRDGGRFGYA